MKKIPMLLIAALLAAPAPAWSWGFKGHQVVGEIADQLIARDHPALKERLDEMLQGKSLSDVAIYPDCLLFSCNAAPRGFFAPFIGRNPDSARYHFTDVPLQRKRYVANSGGTHHNDVVQILRYAVARLRGQAPASGPANFTEDEAVWAITHLVGDIHQPLHVGSIYFDDKCATVVDPNVVGAGENNFGIGTKVAETHGGGWLKISASRQLHKLWDNDAVERAMRNANADSIQKFASVIVASPPSGWQTSGDATTWSRRWADEILPLAREAHNRITINVPGVDQDDSHKVECRWNIDLKPGYDEWAAERVREQLAKAGFRLVAMLRASLEND
jgi:hypothetical protein